VFFDTVLHWTLKQFTGINVKLKIKLKSVLKHKLLNMLLVLNYAFVCCVCVCVCVCGDTIQRNLLFFLLNHQCMVMSHLQSLTNYCSYCKSSSFYWLGNQDCRQRIFHSTRTVIYTALTVTSRFPRVFFGGKGTYF
jgi:hypothetical protein